MTKRNTYPSNQFDLLQRALNCNKTQLAAHIGIHPNTLSKWTKEGPGRAGTALIAQLWGTILRQSGTECLEVSQIIKRSKRHE